MAVREISYRDAINEALREEMERDPTVCIFGEDVGRYGGPFQVTRGLYERFGEWRVRDTPISEEGFTGMAVGAAMTGLRPVVEIMYNDFVTLAMDQIINQAAKARYMFGGKARVPMVIRTQGGAGRGNAAQHSQSLEMWFVHIPGL
ncbi:MAG: alpha-ketoacid dehydrogenase subunit beta, partial [Anaerolineae bacterium]|nr:alpha-ketoacid dehydrogenase subunit beta [Anaerolineae bacterium]